MSYIKKTYSLYYFRQNCCLRNTYTFLVGLKIVKKMKALGKTKAFEDLCWLLYEQAMLIEGVKLPNPATFVTRLNNFLIKSI